MSPSIGTLLNGLLIPNSLKNPFAPWFLINLDSLLPHIAPFDNVIALPLLVFEIFGSMFSVFFYTLNNTIPFYTYALFIKYFKTISLFFSKLFGAKRFVNSVHKSSSFKHKINKSNRKVSAHY